MFYAENMPMEKELINYILELSRNNDNICVELHDNPNEVDYCSQKCQGLNENCVRRLMYNRIINGKK